MGAPGRRRQARELALQVLYAADAAHQLEAGSIGVAFAEIAEQFTVPARARRRARQVVLGVVAHLAQIDERIARASRRWKLYRLAAVDRNVLRVAAFELLYEPDTPAEVVIDEAVEIARRYAGEASPAFVNGVLDQIARQRDAAPRAPLEGDAP